MSLTYKIASTIVRLIGVKKMFLKNKEEMLEYAKSENAKIVFDLEKAKARATRKNYYLYDRDVMGYRLISYQKNQTPADGAVLYLFGGGMITQPNKLDFKLSERIMEQTGKDVWFLFYPLCSENVKIDKIISVSPGGIPDVTVDENKEIWKRVNALNYKDVMIDPTYIKTAREIAKGDEDIPEYMLDGTVGDFTDFPKTYFYFGENECLYAFAQTFKKAMEKYHVPYEIIVGKGMCHCYPLVRFFREGREAQDEIIELLGQ